MAYQLEIPHGAFHTVTAPEHCAWPNLTLLPNGEIGAVIHNRPSHSGVEADVELWISGDGGDTWYLRGQITQHEPGTNRMNVAAGLNQKGELIVLCSGWNLDRLNRKVVEEDCLLPHVCISGDNGNTWELVGEMPLPNDARNCIPFGDVVINGDELAVSVYSGEYTPDGHHTNNCSRLARSPDGGRTWGDYSLIGAANFNETDLLITGDGTWLAAARLLRFPSDLEGGGTTGANLILFSSQDAGRTWEPQQYLSLPSQHPAHLLQLADGRILLTYGSRIPECRGILGKVSEDDGKSWSSAFTLCTGPLKHDWGYPSDVQLQNGDIVTAYYCKWAPWCQRYHMGVLRWNLDMVDVGI